MKLRGIGNKDKNTFSEEKNKESNNNKDQALVASRNYLLNGKTLFFR